MSWNLDPAVVVSETLAVVLRRGSMCGLSREAEKLGQSQDPWLQTKAVGKQGRSIPELNIISSLEKNDKEQGHHQTILPTVPVLLSSWVVAELGTVPWLCYSTHVRI